MEQTFFIKLDKAGYVRDIITYAYEGFQEIQYDDVLPVGVMGGYYKWVDGEFVFDKERKAELDVITKDTTIQDLEKRLEEAEASNKQLAEENKVLKAKSKALSDRAGFTDDVIAEMAAQVYK